MIQTKSRIRSLWSSLVTLIMPVSVWAQIPMHSHDESQRLLYEVVDISKGFRNSSSTSHYCPAD
jgi:hypothetical protein